MDSNLSHAEATFDAALPELDVYSAAGDKGEPQFDPFDEGTGSIEIHYHSSVRRVPADCKAETIDGASIEEV